LHPKYKLSYIVQQDWPQEWINTARTVVQTQWLRYKPAPVETVEEASSIMNDLFDMIVDEAPGDELEEYLVSSRILNVTDPIKYWRQFLASLLARMALDFLTAPGM
ncbi:hypothetical protein OF83DRAFT_1042390, partial [Amylostereum chailletii]